jgi:hypothetical protein
MTNHVLRGITVLLLAAAFVVWPKPSDAQSNASPAHYMYDSRPTVGWPPTYTGESKGTEAVVVEGIGVLGGCAGTNYTEALVKSKTVSWINSSKRTVTEITPQTACDTSISHYESLIDRIVDYVEANAPALAPQYWAGIMLDEEPGYGFTLAQLEALNDHVDSKMTSAPGMSWFFTEAEPYGWGSVASYDALVNRSTRASMTAPQVYNSNFLSWVNTECSTYGVCRNLVTVGNLSMLGSYADPEYTLPKVDGSAWYTPYTQWFPYEGWWNGYRNQ